jgi:hypothetical protein
MYNLDTKEEVDMNSFFEAVENGEILIVSKEHTEEEWQQLRRDIAEYKAAHHKKQAVEPVLA